MSKNNKKPPMIEYYPVHKPTIKVPLPEMADVIAKLSNRVEASLDINVEITRDCAWAFYGVAAQIKDKTIRDYYLGVIRKWLKTDPIVAPLPTLEQD